MGDGTWGMEVPMLWFQPQEWREMNILRIFLKIRRWWFGYFAFYLALACCHWWKTGTHGLGSRAACFPLESNETRINTEPTEYHWPLSDGGRGKGVPLQIGSAGACFFLQLTVGGISHRVQLLCIRTASCVFHQWNHWQACWLSWICWWQVWVLKVYGDSNQKPTMRKRRWIWA